MTFSRTRKNNQGSGSPESSLSTQKNLQIKFFHFLLWFFYMEKLIEKFVFLLKFLQLKHFNWIFHHHHPLSSQKNFLILQKERNKRLLGFVGIWRTSRFWISPLLGQNDEDSLLNSNNKNFVWNQRTTCISWRQKVASFWKNIKNWN